MQSFAKWQGWDGSPRGHGVSHPGDDLLRFIAEVTASGVRRQVWAALLDGRRGPGLLGAVSPPCLSAGAVGRMGWALLVHSRGCHSPEVRACEWGACRRPMGGRRQGKGVPEVAWRPLPPVRTRSTATPLPPGLPDRLDCPLGPGTKLLHYLSTPAIHGLWGSMAPQRPCSPSLRPAQTPRPGPQQRTLPGARPVFLPAEPELLRSLGWGC